MFPVLMWVYVRLAKRKERHVLAEFGEKYRRYARIARLFRTDVGRIPVSHEA